MVAGNSTADPARRILSYIECCNPVSNGRSQIPRGCGRPSHAKRADGPSPSIDHLAGVAGIAYIAQREDLLHPIRRLCPQRVGYRASGYLDMEPKWKRQIATVQINFDVVGAHDFPFQPDNQVGLKKRDRTEAPSQPCWSWHTLSLGTDNSGRPNEESREGTEECRWRADRVGVPARALAT